MERRKTARLRGFWGVRRRSEGQRGRAGPAFVMYGERPSQRLHGVPADRSPDARRVFSQTSSYAISQASSLVSGA